MNLLRRLSAFLGVTQHGWPVIGTGTFPGNMRSGTVAPGNYGWDLSTGSAPPGGPQGTDEFVIGRPGTPMQPYAVSLESLAGWLPGAVTSVVVNQTTVTAGTTPESTGSIANGVLTLNLQIVGGAYPVSGSLTAAEIVAAGGALATQLPTLGTAVGDVPVIGAGGFLAVGIIPALPYATTAYVTSAIAAALPASGGDTATVPVTSETTASPVVPLVFAISGDTAYDVTLSQATTFTLTGGTAGQMQKVSLVIRQPSAGGFGVNLPANVRWGGGVTPSVNLNPGTITFIQMLTTDGGVTVLGQ